MKNTRENTYRQVDALTKSYLGHYSSAQAKSLAWADIFEEREIEVEYKYQGRVIPSWRYDCSCRTCGTSNTFGAAGSIRTFINLHKDHDTRTFRYS